MGIIEQWGTGIQRMIQGCREYGVREPEFIDMGDAFRVNFYRSGVETGTEKVENSTEIAIKVDDTDTEKIETSTQTKIIVLSVLPDTERKIVGFILENPGITQEQIAENMRMSKNGIRYAMGRLKDKGILMREGATKKGKWIINLPK